jgi:DNA topoisomerase-1
LEIYGEPNEKIVPKTKKGDIIKDSEIGVFSDETKPPKKYNQATILKKLEDLGLGTKGTRASILQTLYDRDYIEDREIRVTELGESVINALEKYCPEILSVDLTREFDEGMVKIQEGKIKKEKIIEDAKKLLVKILNNFKKNEKEIGTELLKGLKKSEALGKCRCSGDLKIIRMTNGKNFVGCSRYPKCKNMYPLPGNAKIEKTGKICEKCNTPIVKVIRKARMPFTMCLDPKCETKAGWKKVKKS